MQVEVSLMEKEKFFSSMEATFCWLLRGNGTLGTDTNFHTQSESISFFSS